MKTLTTPAVVKPKGFETSTDLSSAVSLTVPAGAEYALLQATGDSIRFRDDGTNPTASVGMRLVADAAPFPYTGDLSALRFVEEGTSAVLNVLYYALGGN